MNAATTKAAAEPSKRWLFGPGTDLLFGCGVLYVAIFAVQAIDGPGLRETIPLAWLPLLSLVLGAPHYGATLLRVYAHRQDRQRYAIFAVHASAVIAVIYLASLHLHWLGTLMVTLYLTWSPWHYSGQNYGVCLLFLRRRGVSIRPLTKRLIYSSFLLSYGLVFLALHGTGEAVMQAPASYELTVYRFASIGLPIALRDTLAPLLAVAYLACVFGAMIDLGRRAPLRDLAPSFVVIGVQALWFLIPTAAQFWSSLRAVDPLVPDYRPYAFMWVAVGHFLQYLWITTYYAAASEGPSGRVRYLVKSLVAGIAIWVGPTLIFRPGLLGPLPFDLGLGLLTASAVNIHHFVLDGAIWKLRDGRVARALLRPAERSSASPSIEGRRHPWAAALAWSLGSAILAVAILLHVDHYLGNRAAKRGDVTQVRSIEARRSWFGRGSTGVRAYLARKALQAGHTQLAHREIQAGMSLHPTIELWMLSAQVHESKRDWESAAAAYEAALGLEPNHLGALYRSAVALEKQGDVPGAVERLERAVELAPEQGRIRLMLERLSRS